jgi:EAL domain-containing protein (putative c-di-GMP-specific phosphodiesterase class I)
VKLKSPSRTAILAAAACGIRQKIFINFTPNSIYMPRRCLKSTVRMVDEAGLRREQVVFEIVEIERLPDAEMLKAIVRYYRDEGFGVALDDLGTEYSSLTVLLALRPDYVKLDRELLRGVHEDAAKATLARKLLEAARELGIKTIAEGIETRDEFAWARRYGADYAQGYLFARPAAVPPAAVHDLDVVEAAAMMVSTVSASQIPEINKRIPSA